MSESRTRAIEMLRIAAKYIKFNDPEGRIDYDEAICDGYCVADDCESAAEMLEAEDKLVVSD